MAHSSKKHGSNHFSIREQDVAQIKNHTASTIEWVHGTAFLVFYFFETVLEYILEKIDANLIPDGGWGEALRIFLVVLEYAFGALAFMLVLHLIKHCYTLKLKMSKSKYDLPKEWYHVHIPQTGDGKINFTRANLSAGETLLCRNLDDFTFYGKNYDYTVEGTEIRRGEEVRTSWFTETAEICDDNETDIIEVYKAESTKEQTVHLDKCPLCTKKYDKDLILPGVGPGKFRYGIHKHDIKVKKAKDGSERKYIECAYTDCWPSLKSGKLYLFDNPEDRDEKIKWYFAQQRKLEAGAANQNSTATVPAP